VPELTFHVEGAKAVPYSASPLLALQVRIGCAAGPIHSLGLHCQVRIEAARRRYAAAEQAGLVDLFGTPERWGQTLRSLLWANTSVAVPAFSGSTVVDLPLPCSGDFNLAVTRYMSALEDGEVPLALLFSGTIFHASPGGALQVAQVPWDREAAYRLPVRVWREMMNHYFPGSAWLVLRQDVLDRLARYKSRGAFATWEQALESLLPPEGGGSRS
jgi:hypothetical protein